MKSDLPKIGAPAERALESAGIRDLKAVARHRESDLAKLHGIGPKALKILKAALASAGLTFKK